MIIESAAIKMHAHHQQSQNTARSESLRVWHTPPQPQSRQIAEDTLILTDQTRSVESKKSQLDLDQPIGAIHYLSMQIIRRMVKEITGQEMQIFSPEELQGQMAEISYQPQQPARSNQASSGMGLIYQQQTTYLEAETTTFNAEGNISTKDGQAIAFSVSLSMSREFYAESSFSFRAGDAAKIDPLVINFDGNAAELSDTKFQFDIDANGTLDQIASLKSNTGMLALDRNQDGVINDGSELFGPNSGNGFIELVAYDEDKNQFIDEADSIYQQLRIWQRHADGSQQLLALGDKNIGAIYLGHVISPFQIKNQENNSLGEVASSSIYLTEQGAVGTIQQINFTV
jgi:hypothetical protein